MTGPTVAEIRQEFERTAIGALRFQIAMWTWNKPTYADWADKVEQALLAELPLFAERRHDFHAIDEDGLSGILILAFKHLGLSASSAVVNGNCDLKVELDDYVWLGEAKITRSVSKIFGGYLQLTQRYSPGIAEQNRGGLLLFCVQGEAKSTLDGWKAALEVEIKNAMIKDGTSSFTFSSRDTSSATGLDLKIFHIIFPLTHKPVDATRVLSKAASKAGAEAKVRAAAPVNP